MDESIKLDMRVVNHGDGLLTKLKEKKDSCS